MKKFHSILIVLLGIQRDIAKASEICQIKSDLTNYLLPYKVEVHIDLHDHPTFTKTKHFFKNTEFNSLDIQYRFPITVNAFMSSSYRTNTVGRCDKWKDFQMCNSPVWNHYIVDVASNQNDA